MGPRVPDAIAWTAVEQKGHKRPTQYNSHQQRIYERENKFDGFNLIRGNAGKICSPDSVAQQ
jgi:hypothetical protein